MISQTILKSLSIAASSAICFGLLLSPAQPALAYETDGLLLYLNAAEPSSYNGGTTWNDLSGNDRDGTLVGAVVYDPTSQSLQFPGGANGTAYVNLAGQFSDFSSGMTIEFEGEFGSTRSSWERIFDFGVPGGLANDVWVGHLYDSNELAIETWHNGINQGRCRTSTSGTALGSVGSREFAKWLISIDNSVCRIYKNGVELPTQVKNASYTSDTPVAANGSTYPLPLTSNRTTNYLGRSNWSGDSDLEGSIRYIRVYNRSLSSEEALENANNSDAPVGEENSNNEELANTGISANVLFAGVGSLIIGAAVYSISTNRTRRIRRS